jgi:hypothetical protein
MFALWLKNTCSTSSSLLLRALLKAEAGKQDLLDRGVAIATEIFSGCDFAGVEGPCFDAIWSGETVHVADLARDLRWPRWGPQVVADLGVASMLSYQLFTTGETLGALNLYSRSLDAFDPDDINNGYALAANLAVAIAGADTTEQLTSAIASRTAIGQAEGILMERFDLQPA